MAIPAKVIYHVHPGGKRYSRIRISGTVKSAADVEFEIKQDGDRVIISTPESITELVAALEDARDLMEGAK